MTPQLCVLGVPASSRLVGAGGRFVGLWLRARERSQPTGSGRGLAGMQAGKSLAAPCRLRKVPGPAWPRRRAGRGGGRRALLWGSERRL